MDFLTFFPISTEPAEKQNISSWDGDHTPGYCPGMAGGFGKLEGR
jgi:hypothetical protein